MSWHLLKISKCIYIWTDLFCSNTVVLATPINSKVFQLMEHGRVVDNTRDQYTDTPYRMVDNRAHQHGVFWTSCHFSIHHKCNKSPGSVVRWCGQGYRIHQTCHLPNTFGSFWIFVPSRFHFPRMASNLNYRPHCVFPVITPGLLFWNWMLTHASFITHLLCMYYTFITYFTLLYCFFGVVAFQVDVWNKSNEFLV